MTTKVDTLHQEDPTTWVVALCRRHVRRSFSSLLTYLKRHFVSEDDFILRFEAVNRYEVSFRELFLFKDGHSDDGLFLGTISSSCSESQPHDRSGITIEFLLNDDDRGSPLEVVLRQLFEDARQHGEES